MNRDSITVMETDEVEKRLAALERENRRLSTGLCGLVLVACLILGLWNLYQA